MVQKLSGNEAIELGGLPIRLKVGAGRLAILREGRGKRGSQEAWVWWIMLQSIYLNRTKRALGN